MLTINNLHVSIDDKEILKGLSLTIGSGEVHAIMGPNGSGKSTLSYVLAGREEYTITSGEIVLNGENILAMEPEQRAIAGLFLAFQYPVEIPGVATATFLRTALNAVRSARGEKELDAAQFLRLQREKAKQLGIADDMVKRALNVGFSGGEKKRMEALQMLMLQPSMIVMDETDSGLDIDALRIVADAANSMRDAARSFLVITHYQRLLNHIQPDYVHIMADGVIVKSGGAELATELEAGGYAAFGINEAA